MEAFFAVNAMMDIWFIVKGKVALIKHVPVPLNKSVCCLLGNRSGNDPEAVSCQDSKTDRAALTILVPERRSFSLLRKTPRVLR